MDETLNDLSYLFCGISSLIEVTLPSISNKIQNMGICLKDVYT